jgi:hypothetical protein
MDRDSSQEKIAIKVVSLFFRTLIIEIYLLGRVFGYGSDSDRLQNREMNPVWH